MAVAINGTGSISGVPAGGMQDGAGPVLMTAQASTSGTSIDFTGIPSWAKRVTVMMNGVSTTGTSIVQIQLGTSGGIVSSGYLGTAATSGAGVNDSSGFQIEQTSTGAFVRHGAWSIVNFTGNTWVITGMRGQSDSARVDYIGGSIPLAAALTTVRITTVGGTDTFDAGSLNIMYE